MVRFSYIALLVLLSLVPARAVDSLWVDQDPARWRMIVGEVDGKTYAALQVQLKPGWHTYWRFPGASGIAPEFNFEASGTLSVGKPVYQAPYFYDDGVGGYFGYGDEVGFVFPLAFTRNKAALDFSGLIGVCREVCVPMDVQAGFMLDTKRIRTSPHGPKIAEMLAASAKMPSDDLAVGGVSFDGVSLQVVVTGENLSDPSVMIVPGPHDIIGPPRIAAAHPNSYLIEVPAWSKLDHPLIGRKLDIVIRDGDRAIETQAMISDHRLVSPDMVPNLAPEKAPVMVPATLPDMTPDETPNEPTEMLKEQENDSTTR